MTHKSSELCDWCRRPGRVHPVRRASLVGRERRVVVHYENPILCAPCRGLLGWGPEQDGDDSGAHEADQKIRDAARRSVEERLSNTPSLRPQGSPSAGWCRWCRRPGRSLPAATWQKRRRRPDEPMLCATCAGLLGYRGIRAVERAVAVVESELSERYWARRRADPAESTIREMWL
jgi:hypothetical protein